MSLVDALAELDRRARQAAGPESTTTPGEGASNGAAVEANGALARSPSRTGRPTRRGGVSGALSAAATGIGRLYARRRAAQLAAQDPAAVQEEQLRGLVRGAAATRFGREHGFEKVATVADYQARVPLRTYDQLWEEYWKDAFPRLDDLTWPGLVEYFAVSSGTSTGRLKYIPCTRAMIRSNYRAASDVLVHHLMNRPDSRALGGKTFVFGGSADLVRQDAGIYSGDISGIAARNRAWWTRPFYFPPASETMSTEWDEKMRRLGSLSLQQDIRAMTGGTNWLLLFFEHLASLRPDLGGRVADFYPRLEVVVHGGVSLAPYKERFARLLEGSRAEMREVYPASEAFVAVADRGPGEGLRMNLDHGVFYEFVPVSELASAAPTRHWAGNVETGVDYALAVTSCAGLWSYLLGDVVRLVDRAPPRLLVTGRTSYYLSTFGEHVTGELVESTLLAAAAETGLDIAEFSVGTEVHDGKDGLGRHVYVIEFRAPVEDPGRVAAMAGAVDRILAERNEDYRERRAVAGGIQAPTVVAAPPGTFTAWMKARGKLGGQHKIPRVIGDAETFGGLVRFALDSGEAVTCGEGLPGRAGEVGAHEWGGVPPS